ncbi:MAG: Uma2 family endonuclease [Candidatus Eremiobacteraeota bacterium]|nr:Uma2 family endonuclease [Candidatus Eremiobacteraeota bacterium]
MVETKIPRWLAALDENKPYIEVLDGERVPDVSPKKAHGLLAVAIGASMRPWARGRGGVGAEIRYYFLRPDGRWSSLLPDVSFMSYARHPLEGDDPQRPRVAPDIAVEIVSPGDRPSTIQRKVTTYLEYGSTVVLVLYAEPRRVAIHRAGGSVEERDARGTWLLEPYDLALDWEDIFYEIDLNR